MGFSKFMFADLLQKSGIINLYENYCSVLFCCFRVPGGATGPPSALYIQKSRFCPLF